MANTDSENVHGFDHQGAYRSLRSRVTALARDLDTRTATQIVPAAPDWRVKDLVAHLAGVTADVLAGNIDGAGSDAWTAAQVEARRDTPLNEILKEWNGVGPEFESLLPMVPILQRGQVVFDAATHEHDLRGALGSPGARHEEATDIGFHWGADILGQLRDGNAAGALLLRTDVGDFVVGQGNVTTTVTADRFELFRAMVGRRSVAQVKAYGWDPGPSLGTLCFFPCRSDDLVE